VADYKLTESEKKEIYLEWLKVSVKKHELMIKEFDASYFLNKG
jgi:hypothetical protein